MIININGDGRRFLRAMKTLKGGKTTLPLQMTYRGIQYFGADRFASLVMHLQSCFAVPTNYFRENVDDFLADIDIIYQANYEALNTVAWVNFENIFDLEDIRRCITEIDIKKDPGPMLISALVLKHIVDIAAPLLLNVMNSILQTGIIPSDWKTSYITPIPKKGVSSDISNYRGISMQSIIPKMFDKLLTKKLYEHIHHLIPATQHGFMKKKGTLTNLLEITQFLRDEMHKGNRVDVIYFDLAKAFDRVDHAVLAAKLSHFAVPIPLYRVIMNFVTNRKYILKVDGTVQVHSEHSFTTKSSVPQGSHIGPLLFLIICFDMNICTKDSSFHISQLADDTKIYGVVNNTDDALAMQQIINSFERWVHLNKLELNANKTYHVAYYDKQLLAQFNYTYLIGTTAINTENSIRDLGVIFDSKLRFTAHVHDISEKAMRAFGVAYRFARDISHRQYMVKILKSYIMPLIEYCSPVWSITITSSNEILDKVLRKATRFALGSSYMTGQPGHIPYEERLEQCKLVCTTERRRYLDLMIGIKIMKGEILTELRDRMNQAARLRHTTVRHPRIFDCK